MARRGVLLAVIAAAVPAVMAAGVTRSSDWTAEMASVRVIALAPVDCRSLSITCGPADGQLLVEVKKAWSGDVVPFYKVRQVMFDQGVEAWTPETVAKVLGALGADALLVPSGLSYDRETVGPGFLGQQQTGEAQLILYAKSGKKLVEGTEAFTGVFVETDARAIFKPLQALVKQAFRFAAKPAGH